MSGRIHYARMVLGAPMALCGSEAPRKRITSDPSRVTCARCLRGPTLSRLLAPAFEGEPASVRLPIGTRVVVRAEVGRQWEASREVGGRMDSGRYAHVAQPLEWTRLGWVTGRTVVPARYVGAIYGSREGSLRCLLVRYAPRSREVRVLPEDARVVEVSP